MIQYILFDLDETLYPATSGLMPAIGERMRLYLEKRYQLDPAAAHELQKRYWNQYGTTLRGLILEREIDPGDYLLFVHDVDVSQFLEPDERLDALLQEIPYPKVIVTNADAPHARRVLERLGIAAHFRQIFDIVFMQYECKPARAAYEHVLAALQVRGEDCILIEDSARNLAAARELGIRTVLVNPPVSFSQPGAWRSAKDHSTGDANPGDIGSSQTRERWRPPLDADPAANGCARECPPEANLCISDIYGVADAIRAVAAMPLTFPSSA